MKLPVPSFVPVPAPEAMRMIAAVLFLAGCCLVGTGLLCLFLRKRTKEEPAPAFVWVVLVVGAVLMVDHGVQLLF